MALITGQIIPIHYPTNASNEPTFAIPAQLGIIYAQPTTSSLWTLPPLDDIVRGASLVIRNTGTGTITITPSGSDTIDGPTTVSPNFTTQINTDSLPIWRVTFNVAITASIIPPSASFFTYQIASIQLDASSTTMTPVAYFPWLQSAYSAVVSATFIFNATVAGPALTVQVANGVTILGSVTVSSTNTYSISLISLPSSNTTLTFSIQKATASSPDPVIFGMSLIMAQ